MSNEVKYGPGQIWAAEFSHGDEERPEGVYLTVLLDAQDARVAKGRVMVAAEGKVVTRLSDVGPSPRQDELFFEVIEVLSRYGMSCPKHVGSTGTADECIECRSFCANAAHKVIMNTRRFYGLREEVGESS